MQPPELTRARRPGVFDLNSVYMVAIEGAMRAYRHVGFAVQAAASPSVDTYRLGGFPEIIIGPEGCSPEELAKRKNEFQQWVIGQSLSDVVSAQSLFIDIVARLCAIAENHRLPRSEHHRAEQRATRIVKRVTSLAEKAELLAKLFGIDTPLRHLLPAITKVRNALVHGAGLVHEQHCTEPGVLCLRWRALEIEHHYASGRVEKPRVGERLGEEGTVYAQFVQREKVFPKGRLVNLAPAELHELLLMFPFEARTIMQGLTARLDDAAVPYLLTVEIHDLEINAEFAAPIEVAAPTTS